MTKKIFFIFVLLLPMLACASTQTQPTQNVDVIVQATFQALTLQAVENVPATSTASSEATAVPNVVPTNTTIATGSIAGNLSYPSSFIPAQTIVAFDANSTNYFYVNTAENQSTYQIDNLPVGNYYVVTYTQDGALSAGYSQAVPCGLLASCTDNSLISVSVSAGQVTNNINPQDWYAPPNSFPANPVP